VLSLCELRRVAAILSERFEGHRVERFVQPDAEHLALCLYGRGSEDESGRKRNLLLCVRPELARIAQIDALPSAPQNPPAFVSYLRAHLSRARLLSASVRADDRQLMLRFSAREGEFDLMLSLLGNRSNLYVLDAAGELVAALRPLANTRSELSIGAAYVDPSGSPPAEGEDRFADIADAEYFAAVEAEYGPRERARDGLALARELRAILKRESKSARRRLARIEEELAEADQANDLQRHGELLKGALSRIEPGSSEIRVEDYETGEAVVIPLDPKKTPKQNLDATFKRYQKLLRRLTKAGGQQTFAQEWCETVEGLVLELELLCDDEAGPDRAALEELAARPEIGRLLGKRRASGRGPAESSLVEPPKLPTRLRDLPKKLLPRRYLSRDGLEIWVGRSDECNDHLTTRLARGNDLFFHLDGAPGSHVILRTEGKEDPPSESILDACELAVHFSKQKNAGRADVHVVPIKQVKKPKGAKRGLVWVTGGKSVHLRREDGRLERLMAARID
jgi:predicted ribosome quality control (RQC) complex YloA/Tae2 family protein